MKPAQSISIVEGWDYPMDEYIEAHQNNRLIKLVTHMSNLCNLSCPGCFVNQEGDDVTLKRKARRKDEIAFEDQIELFNEAKANGAEVIDMVGAGEPTLDPHFDDLLEHAEKIGMRMVVFTHCATKMFRKENLIKYRDKPISFFVKLWSLDHARMNRYVRGSLQNYAKERDEALDNLNELGLMDGGIVEIDGVKRHTTRVGADILVMKDNLHEIPDIFRFCRDNNIMPLIKTYIPQGPTRLDHESGAFDSLSEDEQNNLVQNAVMPEEFSRLRKALEKLDSDEYGNQSLKVFYPQGIFCTQSAGSLYVTISSDILSCVGTEHVYCKYRPGINAIQNVIRSRIETVSLGCIPRVEQATRLAAHVANEERLILELGKQ